jgi:hypothetical protein
VDLLIVAAESRITQFIYPARHLQFQRALFGRFTADCVFESAVPLRLALTAAENWRLVDSSTCSIFVLFCRFQGCAPPIRFLNGAFICFGIKTEWF